MDSHNPLATFGLRRSGLRRAALTVGLACSLQAVGSAQCQLSKIYAMGGDPCEQFGKGIAIDGDRIVVGAHSADDDPTLPCATGNTGAAYVFERVGSGWIQTARLLASDGGPDDEFGNQVAISGDRIIVGAEYHDGAGGSNSGAAYVFELQGSTWVETVKLYAPDATINHYFGRSVDIVGDMAVVGTRFDQAWGYQSGAIYLYEADEFGVWDYRQKLKATDGAQDDLFANSMATDGTWIVVGAYWKDGEGGEKAGAAYVIGNHGTFWFENQKLEASDQAANDFFGRSVAVDGERIVIGALNDEGSGSAYIFERANDVWTETAKLLPSDGSNNDKFGEVVDIDGDYVVVGSKNSDNPLNSGGVYLYHYDGVNWVEEAILKPIDIWTNDKHGYNVGISGDLIVGGSPFDGDYAGTASVYSISGACGANPYGTEVNAPGSLIHLSGEPALGSPITLGIDNPYGTQAAGSIPFLFISVLPHPAFPMGGMIESNGMAGPDAPCEVLIAPYQFSFAGPPWTGSGNHAPIDIPIPVNPNLVGLPVYVQGALVDPIAAGGVSAGCTTALRVTITE